MIGNMWLRSLGARSWALYNSSCEAELLSSPLVCRRYLPFFFGVLVSVSFTVRQCELSPSHTPHLSSCLYEPTSLSQPTCCEGGEKERRRVSQISLTSTQTEMTPLGKLCHQNTPQANWLGAWWWCLLETHPDQKKQNGRAVKTPSSWSATTKKPFSYVPGEHGDEIMSACVCDGAEMKFIYRLLIEYLHSSNRGHRLHHQNTF